MLSPAERKRVLPSPPSALSFSIVPANLTVLLSIRPWKSLMFSRLSVTGAAFSPSPITIGSWSLERYGPGS